MDFEIQQGASAAKPGEGTWAPDPRVLEVLKAKANGVTIKHACARVGLPRSTFFWVRAEMERRGLLSTKKMAAGSSTPERPELVETQIPTTGDDTRGLGADAEAIGA